MPCFKFCQTEIVSKYFYKKKHVTDIFTIDVNKVLVSNKASYNNGKDWWYISCNQVDRETMVPLFIKTTKNIFNYGVS